MGLIHDSQSLKSGRDKEKKSLLSGVGRDGRNWDVSYKDD